MTVATIARVCENCLGTKWDELFASVCGYCAGSGEWTPSPFGGRFKRAVSEDPMPEFGEPSDSPRAAAPAPAAARVDWGWTKHDGEWAALAPIGTQVEAGPVTLVTKAGKRTDVWCTGKVIARLRYGLVCEFTDLPAQPVGEEAPGREAGDGAPATGSAVETPDCTSSPAPVDLDLTGLVTGLYAVPGGTRLKLDIDVVTEGRWAGWVFVRNAAEYGDHAGERLGTQRPGQMYRGKATAALAAILADPFEAMAEYGRITGRCGACGRKLEDADSVARGMGPVCAAKWGGR